jgi:hypothetical protein
VVEVPVCRNLAGPLCALAASAACFLLLARWNFWMALGGASAVYAAGMAWSEGREVTSFLRSIAGRSDAPAALPG